MAIDKGIFTCIICGANEQQKHASYCPNAPKSESDKVYEARQRQYVQPLSYVIERILHDRLNHVKDTILDSIIAEINAAIAVDSANKSHE